MNYHELTAGIFTVDEFLTPKECEDLIKRSEEIGFEAATIATRRGHKLETSTRNNDRVIVDDPELAARLWDRLRSFTPGIKAGRQSIGLNERFRFYRYHPGHKFVWHADGAYRRDNGEVSQLTFLIYLNSGYCGGSTKFEELEVNGGAGTALVFEHALFHEGSEVLEGTKYVLRSDVMFGPVGKIYG